MGEHKERETLGDIPDDARKKMKPAETAEEKSIGDEMDDAQAKMRPTGSGGSAPPPKDR
jgi:hypothetical protein